MFTKVAHGVFRVAALIFGEVALASYLAIFLVFFWDFIVRWSKVVAIPVVFSKGILGINVLMSNLINFWLWSVPAIIFFSVIILWIISGIKWYRFCRDSFKGE